MSYLHAIILGLIEGVTEFLPVSSTGHLILANHLLGIGETDFVKSFDVMIQLGAILAVVVLYWKTLVTSLDVWKKILAAFLPTAVIGLALYKIVKTYLLGSEPIVLWSLFVGGVGLIIFEIVYSRHHRKNQPDPSVAEDIKSISLAKAFWIGLFQAVAIVPGVSRSAATIVGGLALGVKRRTIVEFSFLLAVPTMAAATGLDALKSVHEFTAANLPVLGVGFVASFLLALVAIKFLLKFVQNHTFVYFGAYRVMLVIFWLLLIK